MSESVMERAYRLYGEARGRRAVPERWNLSPDVWREFEAAVGEDGLYRVHTPETRLLDVPMTVSEAFPPGTLQLEATERPYLPPPIPEPEITCPVCGEPLDLNGPVEEVSVHPECVRPDSLDAAWSEAVAALPEGYKVHLEYDPSIKDLPAMAGVIEYDEWKLASVDAVTPAAALRALAAKLREAAKP